MWIVKSATKYSKKTHGPTRLPHYRLSDPLFVLSFFGITLYNTKTKESVQDTLSDMHDVFRIADKFHPYGLILDKDKSFGEAKEYVLLEVDAISYRFLSYVGKVSLVVVHSGDAGHTAASRAREWYRAIDKECSVFAEAYLNGDDLGVQSLFRVACQNWLTSTIDGCLYIRKARRRFYDEFEHEDEDVMHGINGLPEDYEMDVYKVEFTDFTVASRFVTKAAVSGVGK